MCGKKGGHPSSDSAMVLHTSKWGLASSMLHSNLVTKTPIWWRWDEVRMAVRTLLCHSFHHAITPSWRGTVPIEDACYIPWGWICISILPGRSLCESDWMEYNFSYFSWIWFLVPYHRSCFTTTFFPGEYTCHVLALIFHQKSSICGMGWMEDLPILSGINPSWLLCNYMYPNCSPLCSTWQTPVIEYILY